MFIHIRTYGTYTCTVGAVHLVEIISLTTSTDGRTFSLADMVKNCHKIYFHDVGGNLKIWRFLRIVAKLIIAKCATCTVHIHLDVHAYTMYRSKQSWLVWYMILY